ncbi:uncharacterized protein EAF01_001622 [Botrytis porri]|uniref:uncharacterized protein n=1 Tax=Botrytis porri TaxID=87229 RepID=UPI001900AF11|nr:uncharacterized protein EAF01_001622 [Botrytis porri]KAF7912601.1 hypothetical protein EAF01_001622 [Botrytis porri]
MDGDDDDDDDDDGRDDNGDDWVIVTLDQFNILISFISFMFFIVSCTKYTNNGSDSLKTTSNSGWARARVTPTLTDRRRERKVGG